MDLHNKIISYDEIDRFIPSRNNIIDKNEITKLDIKIRNKEKILFMPTYLLETHLQDAKFEKAKYKIILTGVLQSGYRINVILNNIVPYFEVKIPENPKDNNGNIISKEDFINELRNLLNEEPTRPEKTTAFKSKSFKLYQTEKSQFIKFYYNKLKTRQNALKLVKLHGYETTTDDLNNYYRVVCRDYLTTFSAWTELENYTEVNIENLKGRTIGIDISDYKPYNGELTSDLLRDKTISCCWDIETWTDSEGDVPMPERENDRIFCIGLTFQWIHQKDPFLKICLCDFPAEPNPSYLTVVCRNETNIIRGFSEIFAKLCPEFIFGFNDSNYDWNWLIKRASKTKGLLTSMASNMETFKPYQGYSDDTILKYNFKKTLVKMEAGIFTDGYLLMLHGYLPLDVRSVFCRLHPTSEKSSLKWFLSEYKLNNKEDMPYERLFKIYTEYLEFLKSEWVIKNNNDKLEIQFRENTPENILEKYQKCKKDLADVNYYCIIDAQRCHDLMKVKNVIIDYREISNLSYTSMYDAFYRANGMKVRNLTIGIGQRSPFNIRFSNYNDDFAKDSKYSGAYVFPPKKGLKISKLSIQERIEKAKMYEYLKEKNPYKEWINTPEDEIVAYYKFIEKYGATLSEEEMKRITQKHDKESDDKEQDNEEHDSKFTQSEKFKDFITEEIGRPIAGLDFSSLYPSLIRAYNFSPEYCILDKKLAMEVHSSGQKLIDVKFNFNGQERKAWFVWHNNEIDKNLPDGSANTKFKFGIYPYILNNLFNKRNLIKKEMKNFAHKKEEFEFKGKEYLDQHKDEYEDTIFRMNYLTSKQLGLKVFMNTFYGECGCQSSPFFILEVAASITTYGKRSIQIASKAVKEKQCKIYYGDTDSIYISMPEKIFDQLDREFYTGKIEKINYWIKMVELSFSEIVSINNEVNQVFENDNGTKFLTMAYEEFLYPVLFAAKKKYFGIAHEKLPNFHNYKELFIRGFDSKKRGVSDLLRNIFGEIMNTSVSTNNVKTILELVEDKIKEIYSKKWTMSDFIQTGVYRPSKKNVKIQTFVKRMKEERNIDIKPNERFNYVIVKKYPYIYNYRGNKAELSIGDKIELAEIAEKENYEVDLDYYMQGSLNGQFARLITYHKMFHIDPENDTDEELTIAEAQIYKHACKYIEELCKPYYSTYNNLGTIHKKIYKQVSEIFDVSVLQKDEVTQQLLSAKIDLKKFSEEFMALCENKVDKMVFDNDYGKIFVGHIIEDAIKNVDKNNDKEIKDIKEKTLIKLQKIYYGNGLMSINVIREKMFKETMSILRQRLHNNYNEFTNLYGKYHKCISNLSELIFNKINIPKTIYQPIENNNNVNFDDIDIKYDEDLLREKANMYCNEIFENPKIIKIINEFKKLYYDIRAAYLILKRTRSIVDYLKIKRDTKYRVISRPDENYMKGIINDAISEAVGDNIKI